MITLWIMPVAAKKDRAKIIITTLIVDATYILPLIFTNL